MGKCFCSHCTDIVEDAYCDFCKSFCTHVHEAKSDTLPTYTIVETDPRKARIPMGVVLRNAAAAFADLLLWRMHLIKDVLEIEGIDAVVGLSMLNAQLFPSVDALIDSLLALRAEQYALDNAYKPHTECNTVL